MTRKEILDKAAVCVCGGRDTDYGTPENNFAKIADLWNAYLGLGTDICPNLIITSTDVAMMMCLLKMARITSGSKSEDNFIDLAGYAACAGEIKTGADMKKTGEAYCRSGEEVVKDLLATLLCAVFAASNNDRKEGEATDHKED